jgi:alcohol dehydrogenase (NADP+)
MSTPATQVQLTLRDGSKMPALGFGTWQAKDNGEVAAALAAAVAAGFRHVDCAAVYGNEPEVGAALGALCGGAAPAVARADLFITSKLWNTEHHPDHVEAACRQTIKDLQVGYLDLYLMHWPIAWAHGEGYPFPRNDAGGCHQADVPVAATWAAMERLVDAGLVRHIGVSNFSAAELRATCAAARIAPSVHQLEVQPSLPQNAVRAVNAELGVVTTAYCPLGIGYANTAETAVFRNPAFAAIAARHGVAGGARLALEWSLQLGNVVLVKSVTPARIAENAAATVGGLSAEAMADVAAFGAAHPQRVINPTDRFAQGPAPFFPE